MLRLRHPTTIEFHRLLADAMEIYLRPILSSARPGHCLRITTLPAQIANDLCQRLSAGELDADLAVLQAQPSDPWHKTASALIELRNDKLRPLLAFVPPGEHVPDSLEISTFNEIGLADIPHHVRGRLENELGDELAGLVRNALGYLRLLGRSYSEEVVSRYLLTVVINGSTREASGGAIYQLGLIPDFDLFRQPDDISVRLDRNLGAVASLADPADTLLARVNTLEVKPGPFQEALYRFLRAPGRRPEVPEEWGREIATAGDDSVRRLAFEHWEFEKPSRRSQPELHIHPLALAERPDDGIKVFELRRGNPLKVKWELDQPPALYPDLAYFRIEIVSTSGGTVYESTNIKPGMRASRSRTLKDLHDQNIPDDLYYVRVRAYDAAGNRINDERPRDADERPQDTDDELNRKINESENVWFYVGDEEPPDATPPRNQIVRSFLEAQLLAQFRALDAGSNPLSLKLREAGWENLKAGSRRAETNFNIQYDIQSKYSLPISTLLKRVEDATLAQPHMLGRWYLDLRHSGDIRVIEPVARDGWPAPEPFLRARAELFHSLRQENGVEHLTATCDLTAFDAQIRHYAEAYQAWIGQLVGSLAKTEGSQLEDLFSEAGDCLDLDSVEIRVPFGPGEDLHAMLLAPTHPLRLLWHLQHALVMQSWVSAAASSNQKGRQLGAELRQFMRSGLTPDNLPLTLWHGRRRSYVDAGSLTPFWQLYLPPNARDSRAVRAKIERLLGVGRGSAAAPTVAHGDLLRKIQRYLVQHPYITTLKLNVFNPGDARLLRSAIEALDSSYPHLNYQIRLFADHARIEDIGEALDDLTRPQRQVSEGQDLFTVASRNPLFPKLKYLRGRVGDFLRCPTDFEAHISILFDSFGVKVDNASLPPSGRSSYLYGLIQEPVMRFDGGDGQYVWRRQLVPRSGVELPAAPGGAGLMADLLRGLGELQAALAAVAYSANAAPALQLSLQPDDKELLHQIHTSSDWVLTVDRNLGLEYFDSPDTGQRPIYLLDFTPEFDPDRGERLLLTTRSTKEVVRIISPVLAISGLGDLPGSERLVLDLLRSLSGRLALKLLSSPAQSQEALGLALARLFLEQYELLDGCIVIPLDAHADLFISHRDSAALSDVEVSLQRGDLLLVSFNPDERLIEVNIVEVKCRQEIGALGNYIALKEAMLEQLSSTETALRFHFDPARSLPDRVDRPVKTRQLAVLLEFYRERAVRYGSIAPDAAAEFAEFITTLDAGYHIRFRQTGLVFDFGSSGLHSDDERPDLAYHRVGLDYAQQLIANGLANRQPPEADQPPADVAVRRPTTMSGDSTFGQVRQAFATKAFARYYKPKTAVPSELHERDQHEPVAEPVSGPSEDAPLVEADPTLAERDASRQPKAYHTPPVCEAMLGDGHLTPQYGLLGEVDGRKIGLDLDGCNTLSLFGVQGGGKSYTIGTIVEMAVQLIPGINVLPSPLASVIFHYHESQDYPPEFVSMIQPNDRVAEVERLKHVYGAEPAHLEDVLLLTSADKLADRRREFPSISVEPIFFNSAELSIKDWLFLMGALGNPSMYVQQVNILLRRLRPKVTLASLRRGIEDSNLSENQKELAFMRLSFAEEFIRDDQTLRDKLRPGRLIIVDFRDELIQKEQALGLFVVMLDIFSGAGQGDDHFNKLIVFDEAHKYITHSDLTGHVVETIREMRHKGVSVIFASQDPPSLPATVIELSSVVILHKFNAPKWLSHLKKSVAVLEDLTPEKMGALHQGEAYVWANKATDPIFTRRPVKIRMRPRVTLHGGTTKKAVRD